ncbi:hypothetical protein AKJ37_01725 [candidate division MSBL1 archaeon SCGC-AAA259I09]|uniref:Uncharacterized protein n=1 Tax=candidate division MSBL1 archaeon SCGC-AAA259I09 TaxID=1698267 RepID=A0A133UV52_9EURY|nr:hypothetical protein AKJ37_01725 [candidate division MSBL1 archaeon SCGC-AAA259I09]
MLQRLSLQRPPAIGGDPFGGEARAGVFSPLAFPVSPLPLPSPHFTTTIQPEEREKRKSFRHLLKTLPAKKKRQSAPPPRPRKRETAGKQGREISEGENREKERLPEIPVLLTLREA